MRNVHNQGKGFLAEMFGMSANEARRSLKKLNLTRAEGMTYQASGVVKIPKGAHDAVIVLAKKLTKAIHYQRTGKVFPTDGEIFFRWFTNSYVYAKQPIPILEFAAAFTSTPLVVQRNGRDLSDQFQCHVSTDPASDLMIITAIFGRTFGFVTVSSATEKRLSTIHQKIIGDSVPDGAGFEFI